MKRSADQEDTAGRMDSKKGRGSGVLSPWLLRVGGELLRRTTFLIIDRGIFCINKCRGKVDAPRRNCHKASAN